MSFKYQTQLPQNLNKPCPNLSLARPMDIKAFRIMNNPASDSNFIPGAIAGHQSTSCNGFALSFFISLQAAKKQYESLVERLGIEGTVQRYGDQIGEIDIVQADGVVSGPTQKGHIDLHEYINVGFASRTISFHSAI